MHRIFSKNFVAHRQHQHKVTDNAMVFYLKAFNKYFSPDNKTRRKLGFLVMKLLDFLTITFYSISWIKVTLCDNTASSWRSGPPDGLPELTRLNVECGKEEMTIGLGFSAPYDGSIYSKSNGQGNRCIYVPPHSHLTEATFTIQYDSCGTRSDSQGKFYENTIVIQYDDIVIEAWDEAKKIRCEWHDGYEKSAYKMPITISDLDVVEMNFQGDDVDCWLEVQDGKGPWSSKVEGIVPLGSPLTLVVAIQDAEGHFDMRVKSCIAHDGHKHPIHLTDDEGCVLRPKMMTPFQKTMDTKGTASVIAYSHFYAFKFPETVEVTIQCTVEICRHGCPASCLQGRDAMPPGDIQASPPKDDDIPTYKDSNPFSTLITSRPEQFNQSSTTLTNGTVVNPNGTNTNDEKVEPLETSPNTRHDYYFGRYPYNIYEDMIAEDREDDKINYQDDHEIKKDTALNADEVYYSQFPDILGALNENVKNLPEAEKFRHFPNETDETSIVESRSMENVTESTISITSQHDTTPEITDHQTDSKNQWSTTERPDYSTIDDIERLIEQAAEIPANYGDALDYESLRDYEKATPEILGRDDKDTIHFMTTEENEKVFIEPKDSSNKITDENQKPENNEVSPQHNVRDDENMLIKPSTETNEAYKAKARKPVDSSFEERQTYQYRYQLKRHLPPLPPLTLYNGVPLHYYNNPNGNKVNNFADRNGLPYLSKYPYPQKEYTKSKLRRPGRRRGRREIGENEQLGLKQTLRVISVTDLEFFEKGTVPPLHIQKKDDNPDVCVAPSSFAAGLGLLIIANVSVMCVVIFLGHHYFKYRNVKAKTVELLSKDLST